MSHKIECTRTYMNISYITKVKVINFEMFSFECIKNKSYEIIN